jgi:hypothetical protein
MYTHFLVTAEQTDDSKIAVYVGTLFPRQRENTQYWKIRFLWCPCRSYITRTNSARRRKWKSPIWDSKIWSRVPRDSDPRETALARASVMYKRHTHPLVREGAPQQQDRNCQAVKRVSGHEPQMGLDTKTYWLTDWLTVSRNVTLTSTLSC